MRDGTRHEFYDPLVLSSCYADGEAIWEFRDYKKNKDQPGYVISLTTRIPIKYINRVEFIVTNNPSYYSEQKSLYDEEQKKEGNDG
jgi:hypothetical protein